MRFTGHSPNVLVNEATGSIGPRIVEIDGRIWHRLERAQGLIVDLWHA